MSLTPFSPAADNLSAPSDPTKPVQGFDVGVRHFQALDASREDISTGKRQFMVSVFYPAIFDKEAHCALFTDFLAPRTDEALELLLASLDDTTKREAIGRLKSLTLGAQRDLKLRDGYPCPILIYYPGGASHRFSNAALCQELARSGFMVFTLDAPHDAPVVVFPSGEIVPFLPNNDEDYIWPRVTDVRFLLDQIDILNQTGDWAGLLDLENIGMFGHSRGGYLSNICAVEDKRIKAAVNMDGFIWG
ncbi:hypothetical protein EON80_26135, partial [bacterium]